MKAIRCQREIAHQIIEGKANYILSIKENQPSLYGQVEEAFTYFPEDEQHRTWEYNHGRHEVRKCRLLSARASLESILFNKWRGLQSLVEFKSERIT